MLPNILNIGFKVDIKKLWDIDIPDETIKISEIKYNLDIPYLDKMETDDWNLTPRMLINNFIKEKEHAKKVKEADLKYPIEIYFHNNKWIIIDGVHRFTKAVMQNQQTIKVRKLSYKILKNCKI